jgi:hypothetical protein
MATLKHRSRKTVTLVVAGGLTLAGPGEGQTTGESVPFVIEGDTPVGDPVSPGGPSQDIPFTVTNPGDAAQQLTLVTVRVANAGGTTWTAAEAGLPDCTAGDYTVTVTDNPGPVEVAGGDSVTGTATITMNNLTTNQDACQGVDVPLYFSTTALVP